VTPVPDRDPDRSRTNGPAIAAMVVGLLAVPLFFIPVPAALAIALGVIGHRRARDLSGEIIAVIGATIGVVVLGLDVVVVGLHFHDVIHSTPLAEVRLGTCLKETYPEDVVVRKDCSERHGSELFAIVQHAAPAGAPVPTGKFGALQLNTEALDLCQKPFADYVGVPEDRSPTLTFTVDYPSDDEWRRGDRTVRCFAIAKNGAPALRGSVRDTGRAPAA